MTRNITRLLLSTLSISLLMCSRPDKGDSIDKPADPFAAGTPKDQAYEWMLFGEIKPTGWLWKQMNDDLEKGFVGHLDQLAPDLIVKDDIYGKDRLTKQVKSKDVGATKYNEEWEVQYLWWNSETQSNWWDGFVRNSILTNNPRALQKTKAYVDRMLSYQDEDGYMGIYAPDLRFHFNGENGELWAQSTLFRALLAYYESTHDRKVLDAIERGVQAIMKAYPAKTSDPFKTEKPFGGLEHGLTITDTFDRLYQLTGKQEYLDYALWLYANFSQYKVSQEDAQYTHLIDSAYHFRSHGVHTYEQLRPLTTAFYAAGNEKLQEALRGYFEKLDRCLAPSGGPIGDEWIGGRSASADIGYEYCSIHELLDSYSQLLQKSGDLKWADRMEWLLYNAGQGARNPDESSIAYLKTDNSYSMTGPLNSNPVSDVEKKQTRYRYSPVHKEAAVCCVPNAGRIYPYYTKAMWMKNNGGLVAALYGPCEVHTSVDRVDVVIEEKTGYPFQSGASFTITAGKPVRFEISFRKPSWATKTTVQALDATIKEESGMIRVIKTWSTGDSITIQFSAAVKRNRDQNGEYYFSYGPLVYALPLEHAASVVKKYPVNGFRDMAYKEKGHHQYSLPENDTTSFWFIADDQRYDDPWKTQAHLSGKLWDHVSGSLDTVRLVPMGNTILRRVTFPVASGNAGTPSKK